MSTFALLDTLRGEDNPVIQPRATRTARGQHIYDGTIVNNKAIGYVPVRYEHQEFPRMLYHPKWGMTAQPEMAKFAVGCVTAEQFQAAHTAYAAALEKWQRSNRVKLVLNEEDQARLEKKGWLEKPPLRKDNPAFDLNSEEI